MWITPKNAISALLMKRKAIPLEKPVGLCYSVGKGQRQRRDKTTMQVQLTPQIESIVKGLVESGAYHDQEEVIAEAVMLLEDERKLRDLRAALAEAEEELARGEGEEWTPALRARLSAEAQQMVAEGRKPNPDVCP